VSRAGAVRRAGLVGAFAVVLAAPARAGDEAIRLPTTDAHFGPVKDYVEAVTDPD
jgi:hypothetical protein